MKERGYSELLTLTWENVDFRRRLLTVQTAYTKNGERRTIPMNAVLTATLKALKLHAGTARPCSRVAMAARTVRIGRRSSGLWLDSGTATFTICGICSRRGWRGCADGPSVAERYATRTCRAITSARPWRRWRRFRHKVPAIFPTGNMDRQQERPQVVEKPSRPLSSAGESIGLLIRGSQVRILQGVLKNRLVS